MVVLTADVFQLFIKKKPKKTKNEIVTEYLLVGFSVGFSAKSANWSTFRRVRRAFVGIMRRDMIVWCEMAFLQHLHLLRQTVRADTRTHNMQQTIATGYICYNSKLVLIEGTRALGWVVITRRRVLI